MEFKSIQKYILLSPRKLREVASLLKDLKPSEAVEKLPFVPNKGAILVRKVINSAIANAKQKGVSEEKLIFKEIQIGEGPRLKRWKAGARGMAKPFKRRMSHIRIILKTEEIKTVKSAGKKLIKRLNNKLGNDARK